MNVSEIIKKPFSDIKKLVVGILLGGIPILDFFVLGFALEAAKKPEKGLPNFSPNQFILGLKARIVGFFYTLIQMIILLILVLSTGGISVWQTAFENFSQTDTLVTLMIEKLGLPVFIGFFLISLFMLYLSTFGIYEMVKTGSFKDGFNMVKILKGHFTLNHAKFWLLAFLLQFVIATFLSVILSPVYWVPIIASGLISYLSTTIFWIYLGYKLPMKS